MGQNKLMLGFGKVAIFFVLAVVVLAGVAGIFYYTKVYGPNHAKSEPPKLFSKGDYKVADKADGQYIVVDKVGLTAKVPTGWKVEFEGQDNPDGTSQYWVNLMSQDAKKEYGLLTQGCGISITVGSEEDNNQDIKKQIIDIKNGTQDSQELKAGYKYEIYTVNNHEGVKWFGIIRNNFGQSAGLDFATEIRNTIGFSTFFLVKNDNQCRETWENFIKSIVIK